jgi:osmoprotectant transport system permease protein
MDVLQQAWEYLLDPENNVLAEIARHLQLSGMSLLFATLIGVPLGILVSRYPLISRFAINAAGILRVIPSIAILFLLYPIFKLGIWAPVVALTILAVPPLLINTNAGIQGVDPAVLEAGKGMGMSTWQLLGGVQMPLALPVMLAGLRIAAIEVIASATLAVFIAGGGLGLFVYRGLTLNRKDILLVGAIPVALIALCAELVLAYLQRRVTPRHAA